MSYKRSAVRSPSAEGFLPAVDNAAMFAAPQSCAVGIYGNQNIECRVTFTVFSGPFIAFALCIES